MLKRRCFKATRVALPMLVAIAVANPSHSLAEVDRGQPVKPGRELELGADVSQVVGLPSGPAVTGAELDRRTEDLSSRMRCPVCQGNAVRDSPSESARNMKSQIRAMIAAGYDDDQIFRYFETSYGEFIRLMPRAEGFNLLVWLAPFVAMVLGIAVMVVMVRRRSATAAAAAAGSDSSTAATASGAAAATETVVDEDRGEQDPALDDWIARVREEVGRKDA
jgi:cytochrome c-type biogenesis protein CcmH